jgi:hypothetical protein
MMADQYVCNVQRWGASPVYRQGELIPEDCPYDLKAAAQNRKVVTVADYKAAHPDWDPEAQARRQEARAAFPGRDLPEAADMPDPEAEAAIYEDAAKAERARADRADEPKPVQVQQGSTAPASNPAPRTGGPAPAPRPGPAPSGK